MKQFDVTGMHCAACSSRVEKAVSQLQGVESCTVSLLTNSMGVTGAVSDAEIIAAVQQAGYGACIKGSTDHGRSQTDNHREQAQMKTRLFASLGFLFVLMYLSMGHTMLGLPLPPFLDGNPIALGISQMLLALSVMVINQQFFISGIKGVLHCAPNMDTLVSLGSAASFGYSVYALYQMTANPQHAAQYLHEFYFESSAMILAFITLGKILEARSKGKTTDALKTLMKLSPKTVTVVKDGAETVIPIEQLQVGDIFIVRPGQGIAADGIVIEGQSATDESALTGESIPVDKTVGDRVSAPSINQSGVLKCQAVRVGEDTTLSQIIKMVSTAAATKAPIAKIADKVAGIFVPIVMAIALVTTAAWLLLGQSMGFAIARGISVLVISCPCALGLATPVAIMVGNGLGAKNGILFKTAESLEKMGKVTIVALDKTGTITMGQPNVTDIVPAASVTEQELLQVAFSLEYHSEHPLAKAIVAYGKDAKLTPSPVSDFQALSGSGLTATISHRTVFGGNLPLISEITTVDAALQEKATALANAGKTPLFFCQDGKLLGMIAVADTIKADSVHAIQSLKDMGMQVVMLTGDNQQTANAIGKQAGVDKVISGVLPDGKAREIEALKTKGRVAMVGDGINDAPALMAADVGVAIGAGTDIAIDAAEIVLVNSRLTDAVSAIRLSKRTLRTIHQNLFWAFFYNAIGIPLAAGTFIPLFGWQLSPMFGAAAMSLSSFFVVSNALRLNLCDIHNAKQIHKKEEKPMQKIMKIEGMMCGHCEARVKKTLEALEQVAQAEVSHGSGTAVVTLRSEISNEELTRVIEAQDYKVISIKNA